MSGEKTKCSNPECGNDDVGDTVKSYSLEHYGIILCYPCQELARSGKLDVEALKETLKETLKKKDTLGDYVSDGDEELKEFDEKLGEEKVVDAEVVEEGKTENQKWDKTAEIDEGVFSFKEEDGKLWCKNGANNNEYDLDAKKPYCPCNDFVVNKKGKEWCKHLKAAAIAGYNVTQLVEIPKEVSDALVKPEKGKGKKNPKARKEEIVALTIMGEEVELGVQIPTELILSEEKAVETIKAIIGDKPKKEDIIMSYAGIEELNASVITSLAQYIGIRYIPIVIEEEKQRINMGEVYLAGASKDQKAKYEAVAKLMGEVDITVRCKITTVSGWRDKSGNIRIGIGTKEEILLPHDLLDISRRGAAYIRTKCETKSAKKSIINALPVTAEGILRKVKQVYGWG